MTCEDGSFRWVKPAASLKRRYSNPHYWVLSFCFRWVKPAASLKRLDGCTRTGHNARSFRWVKPAASLKRLARLLAWLQSAHFAGFRWVKPAASLKHGLYLNGLNTH